MKGLFLKDFRLLSRQLRFLLVYMIIFIGLFSFISDTSFLTGFITLIAMMLSINCFAYDELCNFDKLVAASPASASQAVMARYAVGLSCGISGSILVVLVEGVSLLLKRDPAIGFSSWLNTLIAVGITLGISVILLDILFPICYRFGVNKSRIILLLIVGLPSFLIAFLFNRFAGQMPDIPSSFRISGTLTLLLVILILILGTILSITLSTRILERKEY